MISRLRALYQRYGTAFWIVLVGGFVTLFLLRERGEAEEIWTVLTNGHPVWIVLIAACYLGSLVVTALTYQVVLRRLGHYLRLLPLTEIHLKRQLVGTVTPVGGPASVYVMVRSLGQRGVTASDALITATLKSVTAAVSFIVILVPALVLQHPNQLILGATAGLVVFLLALLALTMLLLTGWILPAKIEARVPERLRRFVDDMCARNLGFRDLLLPLAFGFTVHVVNTGMLYFGLRAVGYEASLSTVVVGYGIGNLFLIIAPVFQGIGIVELTMALALGQTGVPPITAAGATLLFRFGDLWFPFGLALAVQGAQRVAGWSEVLTRVPIPRLNPMNALQERLQRLDPTVMSAVYSYSVIIVATGLPSGIAAWASFCGAFVSSTA